MLMRNSLIEPTTNYYHIFCIGRACAQVFARYIDRSRLHEDRGVREHVSPLPLRDPRLVSQTITLNFSFQAKRSLHLSCGPPGPGICIVEAPDRRKAWVHLRRYTVKRETIIFELLIFRW